MHKLELFISFLLFLIIIVLTLYYPIFAIEYFSIDNNHNIENVEQIKKCVSCRSYETNNKTFKINEFINNLETNDENIKSNNVLPVLIEKENEISNIFNEDDFDPSCCPSMITSSTGCACVSPELNSFLQTRGNNKNTCY
tara:strand:- start:274 stop:693 length:420 start_codon:yes stop_codon:yes gene_type:complete